MKFSHLVKNLVISIDYFFLFGAVQILRNGGGGRGSSFLLRFVMIIWRGGGGSVWKLRNGRNENEAVIFVLFKLILQWFSPYSLLPYYKNLEFEKMEQAKGPRRFLMG